MVSTAQAAHRATIADVPALARTLARAYDDDPVAVWMCRWDALRPAMLESLYRARLQQMLIHGEVWATEGLSSAAVWVSPGAGQTNLFQQAALIRCLVHPRLLVRVPLFALGSIRMNRKHPHTPIHWYLSLLGTDPEARGHGLGSAVLQPVFERADAEGVGIYLESSKERNIAFYARYGFRVIGTLCLPCGPRMWTMWREPAAAR